MDEQTTDRDRAAAAAVERHHAQMSRTLAGAVWSLTGATRTGRLQAAEGRRAELVAWCRGELVPHALAEESTMYAAAGALAEGRLLVEAMLAEHRAITGLVDQLAATTEPVSAAALGRALQALFEVHLAKENDQVLPLLLATPGVSVAALLGGHARAARRRLGQVREPGRGDLRP